MKVKQLIAELSKLDPEAEFACRHRDLYKTLIKLKSNEVYKLKGELRYEHPNRDIKEQGYEKVTLYSVVPLFHLTCDSEVSKKDIKQAREYANTQLNSSSSGPSSNSLSS